MKRIFLLAILLISLTAFVSCSQSNEPKSPDYKDPREMTWTVDTLEYPGSPQTNMCSIWGSAPTDVWVCGHSSSSLGSIWHFDGNSWNDIYLYDDIEQGPLSPKWVWGIDADNIWIVGSDAIDWPEQKGLILSYNGTNWTKHFIDEGQPIYEVWGGRSDDIWVCGKQGVIYHFDGEVVVLYDSLEIDHSEDGSYTLWSIKKYNGELYLTVAASGEDSSNSIRYLFKKNGDEWIVIDSFSVNNRNYEFGAYKLYISCDNKFYSYGSGGLFRWKDESWVNLYSNPSYVQGCWAINDNYIIVVGGRGEAYHFNGTNWAKLNDAGSEDVLLTGVWTDGYEVFIIGYTLTGFPSKTIVWRGK